MKSGIKKAHPVFVKTNVKTKYDVEWNLNESHHILLLLVFDSVQPAYFSTSRLGLVPPLVFQRPFDYYCEIFEAVTRPTVNVPYITSCAEGRHNMPPPHVTLTFDLLTLRVTWATSVPILVFLGLSVLD